MLGAVYEDLSEWMKHYEITNESWKTWAQESAELMGVPIRTDYSAGDEPANVLPATYAVLAAQSQGEKKERRFMRAILRMFVVEGKDVTQRATILTAAKEAGLDERLFVKAFDDTKARKEEYDRQGEGFPHLPLGFYNLAVSDGGGRTVMLDNAFDPGLAEGAIDYLSDGRLTKRKPVDIVGYLREHGLAPTIEIARVFGMNETQARGRLGELREKGTVQEKVLGGKVHWQPEGQR